MYFLTFCVKRSFFAYCVRIYSFAICLWIVQFRIDLLIYCLSCYSFGKQGTESQLSVAKGSMLFSIGTMISRLSGLIRESVLASVFGASGLLDAFFVAHRIPNMLREMLAEGALGSSFTQKYSQLKAIDPQRARILAWNLMALTSLVGGVVVLLGIIFAPGLVAGMTSHGEAITPEWQQNAIALTRVMFPFIAIMSVTSIVSGVLHQSGKFFASGVSPVALNLGYIVGALVFSTLASRFIPESYWNITGDPRLFGLAVGTVLGALGQFLWQSIAAWKDFRPYSFTQLWNSDVKAVVVTMGPMIIGASAGQINVLVNTNFATSLSEGAVSWISLAFRILQLPIGIFGVAVGTAVLPALTQKLTAVSKLTPKISKNEMGLASLISKSGSTRHPESLSEESLSEESLSAYSKAQQAVGLELQNATELVIWLMTPCMIFLVTSAEPIIQLLLAGGHFDDNSVKQTALALAAYSWGVVPYGLIKVFTAYFYASSRTYWPMLVGFLSIGVNFFLNWVMVNRLGHVGLAATASFVFFINTGLLIFGLRHDKLRFDRAKFTRSLAWVLMAGLISAAICHSTPNDLFWSSSGGVWGKKLEAGLGLMIDGLMVFLLFSAGSMGYLRLSPRQLVKAIRGKLKRTRK